jgi:hypothetical protein
MIRRLYATDDSAATSILRLVLGVVGSEASGSQAR